MKHLAQVHTAEFQEKILSWAPLPWSVQLLRMGTVYLFVWDNGLFFMVMDIPLVW